MIDKYTYEFNDLRKHMNNMCCKNSSFCLSRKRNGTEGETKDGLNLIEDSVRG